MKAKELIKLLEQNPEAEVLYPDYDCIGNTLKVDDAELHKSGSRVKSWGDTSDNKFTENGIFKTDVIILR